MTMRPTASSHAPTQCLHTVHAEVASLRSTRRSIPPSQLVGVSLAGATRSREEDKEGVSYIFEKVGGVLVLAVLLVELESKLHQTNPPRARFCKRC